MRNEAKSYKKAYLRDTDAIINGMPDNRFDLKDGQPRQKTSGFRAIFCRLREKICNFWRKA